jgi:hypothetical protein
VKCTTNHILYVNRSKKTPEGGKYYCRSKGTAMIESTQIRWFSEQSGRWEAWPQKRRPNALKAKPTQRGKGTIRLNSSQIRWFSEWSGRRLDLERGSQRRQGRVGVQGTKSENWLSDNQKKAQLTLSQKGDKVEDEDDDDDVV